MMTATKVYVSYGNTVMENFIDRATGRLGETLLRNAVRSGIAKWANGEFEPRHGKPRVHWDRKLGCGCGCSPGFRVKVDDFYGVPNVMFAKLNDNGTVEVEC
jgi:hypothetical protein